MTDLHLNFVSRHQLDAFLDEVRAHEPDAILLGGDVAEAGAVANTLEMLASAWQVPIYFVLGNHDFYHGSIVAVQTRVDQLCQRVPNLTYLSAAAPIALSAETMLLGTDGWGDGGFGNATNSPIRLNDFTLVEELRAAPLREQRLELLGRLGAESAAHLRAGLGAALSPTAKWIVVLTHVPPFREATWHEGRVSGDDWLPWFSCRATGEVSRAAMEANPDKEMLVLCGHTHGAGEARILPNLRVLTGGAEYGQPRVQRVLEVS